MMVISGWETAAALAFVVGAVAGGSVSAWLVGRRQSMRVQRLTAELQQRTISTIEQSRAQQIRAQAELDQARLAFKRQLASAVEQPRAAAARAEERLREAYDELDRLRRFGSAASPETERSELSDGFAPTRPMHDGM